MTTTWIEVLQRDATLQDFVSAEIARAGIRLDTLQWQHDWDRQRIATLTEQLDAAHIELRKLRRRGGALLAPGTHDAA